jgi:hypothetical protein
MERRSGGAARRLARHLTLRRKVDWTPRGETPPDHLRADIGDAGKIAGGKKVELPAREHDNMPL